MIRIIYAILVIIFLINIGVIIYYKDHYQIEKYKNESLMAQINALKQQADLLNKRYETARQQSLDQMRQIQDKTNSIMKAEIAPDCETAIQFGRDQAKRLR